MTIDHQPRSPEEPDKQFVIDRVRSQRVDLARVLKKHTGIRRIVEELYPDSAHFIFELLQNAEDTGATDVEFILTKDQLSFEHNGRAFSEADILGITDVGKGTKFDDADTIGRFGVGFKAVFAYTESPRIWSPTYSFQIDELVLPSRLDDRSNLNSRTRFEFPFNNAKKPSDVAFKEVENGLRDLAESTLLFLNSLQSISWKIGGNEEGAVLRVHHTTNHIEVLKETNGTTTTSSHYLRFEKPLNGLAEHSQHNIAIAFALEFLPNVQVFDPTAPISKQMKVSPLQGQVAVFFPAEKETSGLRFNLHAPFVPELSRASIKDTPANEPLFEQLAILSAKSMHDLKELGFLTRDFLGVLPNKQDTLGTRYVQIRDAIIEAFNEEALMPTATKVHAPAKHLLQAKASIKELLPAKDIEFLIEYDECPPQWAANRDLQGTDTERFMSGLAITDWDVADFLEVLAEKTEAERDEPDEDFMAWLSQKSADWLQRMYAMFAREPETEDELYQLTSCRVVKLTDGSFSTGDKCYFADEQRRYTDVVPCVDPEILEVGSSKQRKKAARKFLEELNVEEIGEHQLVEALLEKEYSSTNRPIKEKEYLNHLRRFMKFAKDDPQASSLLKNYMLFVGADGTWHKAEEIYLDSPYKDTGISDYYEIVGTPKNVIALADFYKNLPTDIPIFVRFLESLGPITLLPIQKASCRQNPDWKHLLRAPGERYTSPIDNDYKIDGFEEFANSKSVRVAKLIWNTICELTKIQQPWQKGILNATYRKNQSGGSHTSHSQLVHQLKNNSWVPQQGGYFVRPSSARAELLPDGFTFDPGWTWIKAVEFGREVDLEIEKAKAVEAEAIERQTRRQEAAAELGFESEDLSWLEKVKEIPVGQREKIFEAWKKSQEYVDLPENESRNPERRAERVGAMAAEAPDRQTEKRTRSVSVGRENVKAEAAQYLQQQYTSDGEIICQVCKKPMPFSLDDGSPYFEKVEFLSELKKWHHQNYLALCPNHAAMFRHANGTKELMREMLCDITGNELEVVLAQKNETVYFTKIHIADLKAVIKNDQIQPDDDGENN